MTGDAWGDGLPQAATWKPKRRPPARRRGNRWEPALARMAVGASEHIGPVGDQADAREAVSAFLSRLADCVYVRVEESIDDVFSVVVLPWPRVDGRGRLRFLDADGPTFVAHVTSADLQRFVDRFRRPGREVSESEEALSTRPLRVGDVFATGIEVEPLAEPSQEPIREVLTLEGDRLVGRAHRVSPDTPARTAPDPAIALVPLDTSGRPLVIDVSFDAREVAKASYYGAMAPELDPDADADLVADAQLERLAERDTRHSSGGA